MAAVNNGLPPPYTEQAAGIIALKCFRNLTQKSFDIMFLLKNTSFFFFFLLLSFLLRGILLYEKVPWVQTVLASSGRTMACPQQEIRAKDPQKSQRQWNTPICAQHSGLSHWNCAQRGNTASVWDAAICTRTQCYTGEWEVSKDIMEWCGIAFI